VQKVSLPVQKLALFFFLTALGLTANFFVLPLYFGVEHILGSTFLLILAFFYPALLVIVAGAIAYLPSLFHLGHPYTFVLLVSEILVVNLLVRKRKWNIFVADLIYWLLIGIPITWLLQCNILQMDPLDVYLDLVKFPVNGLVNALLANLVILFWIYRQGNNPQYSQMRTPLRGYLFSLFTAFVIASSSLITLVNSYSLSKTNQEHSQEEILTLSTHIHSELTSLKERSLSFILDYYNNYLKREHLPHIPELNQFNAVYLFSENKFSLIAQKQSFNQPSSDQMFDRINQLHFPQIHIDPHPGNLFIVGVKMHNKYLVGIGNRSYFDQLLNKQDFHNNSQIGIFDHQGTLLAKNFLADFPDKCSQLVRGDFLKNNSQLLHLFPEQDMQELHKWKQSHLISKKSIFEEQGYTVIIKLAFQPYIVSLQRYYIREFLVLLGVIIFSIPLIFFASRIISNGIRQISRQAKDLPIRLQTNQSITWESTSITEFQELTENIQHIAEIIRAIFQEQELEYRSIFDQTDEALIVVEKANRQIKDANPNAEKLFNRDRDQMLLTPIDTILDIHDYTAIEELLNQNSTNITNIRYPMQLKNQDGKILFLEANPILVSIKQRLLIFLIIKDVSSRLANEKRQFLSAKVFENTEEGIVITDEEENIIQVNQAFSRITGYAPEDVIGKRPNMLKSDRHAEDFYINMKNSYQKNGSWRGEIWNRRKDGQTYAEWLTINAVYDNRGRISNYIGIFIDITEPKQAQERINKLAYFDILTGLPNRVHFKERLEHTISRYRRTQKAFSLFFIDLDNFKSVNDTLGHLAGDRLIKTVAERILQITRDDDSLARLGGDEFTLIAEEAENIDKASIIANKMLAVIQEPLKLEGTEIFLTTSIGICFFPDDGTTVDDLMRNADTAMYRAKDLGKNNFEFFRMEMNQIALRKMDIKNKMRKAMLNREFLVYYQPQINVSTGKVIGVEALLRWQTPEGRMIPPDEFIPIAEESGLIGDISNWLIQVVCEQIRDWRKLNISFEKVSINISNHQFRQKNFVESISSQIIDQHGLDPGQFELELTERIVMENIENAGDKLAQLKQKGFVLAIDDFGTGNSSLSYLKKFHIDSLKIDKSFVFDIPDDQQSTEIVLAIISMAKALNMRVIAEGVEEEKHLHLLKENRCDEYQGYFFSRPVAAEVIYSIMRQPAQPDNFSGSVN